jgi:hypothetical protein
VLHSHDGAVASKSQDGTEAKSSTKYMVDRAHANPINHVLLIRGFQTVSNPLIGEYMPPIHTERQS